MIYFVLQPTIDLFQRFAKSAILLPKTPMASFRGAALYKNNAILLLYVNKLKTT